MIPRNWLLLSRPRPQAHLPMATRVDLSPVYSEAEKSALLHIQQVGRVTRKPAKSRASLDSAITWVLVGLGFGIALGAAITAYAHKGDPLNEYRADLWSTHGKCERYVKGEGPCQLVWEWVK